MEQNRTAWATDILALYYEINIANVLVHKNKCVVLKFLVDCTAQYVQLWWIGRFEEEINTKSAEAVGKELLGVLKRGLLILQQCGEENFAKPNFVIFYNAGEFCEIVDDVERYSSMMNRCIARVLELDRAKQKLISQLQHRIELDCSMLQDALISAHMRDSDAVKSGSPLFKKYDVKEGFGWLWGLNMKNLSIRRHISSAATLVDQIAATLMDPTCNIANNDLKIEKCLGGGSFGIVSKGIWCGILPVAIKEFPYEETFDYEYTIARKLLAENCSHIVQVLGHSKLEIDRHGSRKILVMELMDKDLKQLLEDKKIKETNPTAASPFAEYESTDLMLQIAKGLRDLHRVEVVHRDIKPTNILVKKTMNGSLTIKLADFGEAKANFQTRDKIHTKRGTTLYMAPEMAADESNYSKKVDVYSYGLVCMEILTGNPLNPAMKEDLKKGQMPSSRNSIPIPLYTIISTCLQLDTDKRPSFEEICDHLWAFKESILIIQDEVPSYDERVLSNIRIYTKTLGEEGISMMPRISTPTGKRAIYLFWERYFCKGVRHLPIDTLVDIDLGCLGIESSGQIKLMWPWDSVRNPFIGTGIEPQNHLSGNLQQDLGILGQFKKLVVDQGKKLNLSIGLEGPFSDAFSTDENRTRFINSLLELCRAYPIFNGLSIDVFVKTIARPEDGQNLLLVLERLRSALPPGFVICLCASTIPRKAEWSMDACHLVDQIYLLPEISMTVQHLTNLYSSSHQDFSYDKAVKYYISRGVDCSKLFIGVMDYFIRFNNADEIGKPISDGCREVVCSNEFFDDGFVKRWDDEVKAPYAYHPEARAIYVYDNARSIKEKVAYIKANNLGGIYINPCGGPKACSKLQIVHDHLTHETLAKQRWGENFASISGNNQA